MLDATAFDTDEFHKIQELNLRLKAIIETAIDGIITIDGFGIIDSINPAACKLFGYAASELLGRSINQLMPAPYSQEHDGYLERYQKSGIASIIGVGREVTGMKKDGTQFPIRLAVSETLIAGKRLYTGIVHDLTLIKEGEEEIRRLNEELEIKVAERTERLAEVVNRLLLTNKKLETEVQDRKTAENALLHAQEDLRTSLEKERQLSELKSRFVSMASHEFRTPLSTILSSVSLIGRYTESQQQPMREKHIDRIKSSVNNLTGILNDFLSLSKLEEGKVDCQPESFNMKGLCEEAIDEIKGLLKHGQEIKFSFQDDDFSACLDKRHLKNILFNLLSNAIKYSEEEKRIWFDVQRNHRRMTLVIKDEGIGIPEEDQSHLFARFFRANNAMHIQGTGLGLNIVKRYVEMLEGTITFQSELGKGSTFTLNLPFKIENKDISK